jgi:urease accessory protein
VHARAAVAVSRDGGRDRLVTLRSEPPLTLRPTPRGLHLVGTSAGPLGGDVLALSVVVGAGAHLTVRSAAATLVQPGARRGPSVFDVDAEVGSGAELVWAPEPTVVVRGADHETRSRVSLSSGAVLVWRDELVLGRHGEPAGSVRSRLRVDREGEPLVRNDVVLGPRWPASLGPAGAGDDTRSVGTALVVHPLAAGISVAGPIDGVRAAVLALADDVVLVTVIAPSPGAVSAALDAALGSVVGAGRAPLSRCRPR